MFSLLDVTLLGRRGSTWSPGIRQTNSGSPATTSFWNAAAFALPAPLTFGNEPRSLANARFHAGKNEDVTLGKKTQLFGERLTVDFRSEFFNIFNRHIYSLMSAGRIWHRPSSLPAARGVRGLLPAGSGRPRTIQFGLFLSR